MIGNSPEKKAREVVEACADCDCCRYIMDEVCQMFPRLYELWDREKETGRIVTSEELRGLVDLCNFCALCPCPNIRADLIEAKTGFVARDGLEFGIRALEDVERLAKICGAIPALSNRLLENRPLGGLVKKAAGIHPDRRMPRFPDQNFDAFVHGAGFDRKTRAGAGRKVAYLAGCTARFLFPEVARATVETLRFFGVQVYVPEQKCCGMPSFLEGDRPLTLSFVRENLESLFDAVEDGYDIVCSCPTCGFMLKNMLRRGAYFSEEVQEMIGADPGFLKVPSGKASIRGEGGFELLSKTIYSKILQDDGYFSCLSPKKRVLVSENTYDAGEYLLGVVDFEKQGTCFEAVDESMLYYAPCHQREQEIGSPYLRILESIPGVRLESIRGNLYCCGMAGIMGFKKDFHEASLRVGQRLARKIDELSPELIVTDCLSCRLQLNQMTTVEVRHPIEIVGKALSIREGH